MSSDSIVDSRLWIRLDLDAPVKANTLFQINMEHRSHFATQMLLYDTVIIPTKDFGIVPILIAWMGLSVFREALQAGAIKFARPQELFGYVGNGGGIGTFNIMPGPGSPFNWLQAVVFGPTEPAPDLQLQHLCPFISRKTRELVVNEVLARTHIVSWDKELFESQVALETYKDIMGNSQLSGFVISHEVPGTSSAKLQRLSGIAQNQFRVLGLDVIRDGIDLVLRVAEINFEIMIASQMESSDIGTSLGAEKLLQEKLRRANASKAMIDGFERILHLENIPDIRPAVLSGDLSFEEIWAVRNSRHGQRFRAWLRDASDASAHDLEQEYVASLGTRTTYMSLPFRAIRMILTTAIGAFEPVTGTVINAADSFFVEKWLSGYTPKLFLDKLRQLPTADEHADVG